MAEAKHEGVSKTTNFAVDPRIMEVEEGFNARPLNDAHVAAMAQSYANGAIFPPLDVRVDEGRIIIVDGHHRRAAALLAIDQGAEIMALDCRQFRGNDADRIAHLCTSASNLQLTPLQRGHQYRRLISFGWTEKQIADRMGEKLPHVKSHLALTEANTDVQTAVEAGEVSATNAVALVKQYGSRAGAMIGEAVEKARLTGKKKATAKQLAGNTPADLIKAINTEMESGGKFLAESLCPRYAKEIAYLRSSGSMAKAA